MGRREASVQADEIRIEVETTRRVVISGKWIFTEKVQPQPQPKKEPK